jgi:hypothetical protein
MSKAAGSASRFYDVGWAVLVTFIFVGIAISVVLAFTPTEREKCQAAGGRWHDVAGHDRTHSQERECRNVKPTLLRVL